MCVVVCGSDDQYFYSIYSSEQRSAVNVTDSNDRAVNVSDGSRLLYCGPLEPSQMLNPVRSLSYEYLPDWPLFAKFLTIISSNAIILSVLFILAYDDALVLDHFSSYIITSLV